VNSVPFSSEFKTECCKLTNVLALYHCYYTHVHYQMNVLSLHVTHSDLCWCTCTIY